MTAKSGSESCLTSGEHQQSERDYHPDDQRQQGSRKRPQLRADKEVADDDTVDGERNRSRNHRLSLHGGVVGPMLIRRDSKRGQRDRGSRSEQTGEALWTQKI